MEQISHKDLAALADELGTIRQSIRRLKDREATVRGALVRARRNAPIAGAEFEVTITNARRRTLDKDRLPPEILNDDRYWKVAQTPTVVTRPCPVEPTSPARRIPVDPENLVYSDP